MSNVDIIVSETTNHAGPLIQLKNSEDISKFNIGYHTNDKTFSISNKSGSDTTSHFQNKLVTIEEKTQNINLGGYTELTDTGITAAEAIAASGGEGGGTVTIITSVNLTISASGTDIFAHSDMVFLSDGTPIGVVTSLSNSTTLVFGYGIYNNVSNGVSLYLARNYVETGFTTSSDLSTSATSIATQESNSRSYFKIGEILFAKNSTSVIVPIGIISSFNSPTNINTLTLPAGVHRSNVIPSGSKLYINRACPLVKVTDMSALCGSIVIANCETNVKNVIIQNGDPGIQNLLVGMTVSGTNVAESSTITKITKSDPDIIELTNTTTGSSSNLQLTFEINTCLGELSIDNTSGYYSGKTMDIDLNHRSDRFVSKQSILYNNKGELIGHVSGLNNFSVNEADVEVSDDSKSLVIHCGNKVHLNNSDKLYTYNRFTGIVCNSNDITVSKGSIEFDTIGVDPRMVFKVGDRVSNYVGRTIGYVSELIESKMIIQSEMAGGFEDSNGEASIRLNLAKGEGIFTCINPVIISQNDGQLFSNTLFVAGDIRCRGGIKIGEGSEQLANASCILSKETGEASLILRKTNKGNENILKGEYTGNNGTGFHINRSLTVGQNITCQGEIICTSDMKFKTNITNIEKPLDKLVELHGVSFNWIHNNRKSIGIVAQDIEEALPDAVFTTSKGKAVNYNCITGLLVEALKEQYEKYQVLEIKFNCLQKLVQQLLSK